MSPVALTPATSPLPAHAAAVVRRANPAPHGWQVLTVRKGDTLSDIAITHRTTVGVLITRNHISGDGHFLARGTHLSVPRTTPVSGPSAGRSERTATYVVRTGDTLAGIAAHHRVSLSTLYSLNAIGRTAYIQPGQRVKVPAQAARALAKTAAAAAASLTTTMVTVRSGDSLGAIALRHRVSQASLMKANGLSVRSLLQIGQKLKVVTTKRAAGGNTFAGRTYSSKIVSAAAVNRAHLARHNLPSRTGIKAMIVSTAQRHGVDPRLALAISWQESGWDQRQVSVANAIGAMQVIPSSGAWASDLVGRRLDLLAAQDNVTAGVVILRSLTRSARTQEEAIAGYYQGLRSVREHGMYPDTKKYVRSVRVSKARM